MKSKIIFIIFVVCLFTPMASGFGITQSVLPDLNINPYIEQGAIVYVNDTIDISGVVPPYPSLAYWDGYDMYNTNATYIIDLPTAHSAYYNFNLDRNIFGKRLGKWYKYDGNYERQGNNIAFVVVPELFKNSTMRFQNGTIINVTESVEGNTSMLSIPTPPPVPIKHVSDYLVARGDAWNMTVDEPTNIWLFGPQNQLLDLKSVNGSVDIYSSVLSGFEQGDYTLMIQRMHNGSNSFNVKYDPGEKSIKWFDPKTFKVYSENIYGYTPAVTLEKFNNIIPKTYDNFTTYKMSLETPSIEIVSISESYSPNETIDESGEPHYNANASFVYAKGYTNVAPGSPLKFIMDENKTAKNFLGTKKPLNVVYTNASGTYGGDRRWFEVLVPFDKYNTALGDHFLSGYTSFSDSPTTAKFVLYDSPPDHYIPSKEVRYISGDNGPEEFIPTPTPIIQTVTVVQTISVIKTVTVPVTPANEVVKAQQQKVIDELVSTWTTRIVVGAIIIVIGIWAISLYLRRKGLDE